jgi:hypothetical protein
MRVCPDCFAVNRSYHSYCQKCSGALNTRGEIHYPRLKVKRKPARRVPTGFTATP